MIRTYWLSTHLAYRCRHSGACCTARWPIPIERAAVPAVQRAIDEGRVDAPPAWYRVVPDMPADAAGLLAQQPHGACVFHRPPADAVASGGCAIHPMRPAACVHFPYVCVLDARGVHVTLSHFCPTAASLLFADAAPVRIVEGPPVVDGGRLPEGLDARGALPPADASGARLLAWADVSAWEAATIDRLASARDTPGPPSPVMFERARAAVPPDWAWPDAPDDVGRTWSEVVAPQWSQWSPVVARYLSAKVHASWALYLGEGPRDVERMVELARTVLQVETVRQCHSTGGRVTRAVLLEAIRQADRLLLHHADAAALVGGVGAGTSERPPAS